MRNEGKKIENKTLHTNITISHDRLVKNAHELRINEKETHRNPHQFLRICSRIENNWTCVQIYAAERNFEATVKYFPPNCLFLTWGQQKIYIFLCLRFSMLLDTVDYIVHWKWSFLHIPMNFYVFFTVVSVVCAAKVTTTWHSPLWPFQSKLPKPDKLNICKAKKSPFSKAKTKKKLLLY